MKDAIETILIIMLLCVTWMSVATLPNVDAGAIAAGTITGTVLGTTMNTLEETR